MRIYLSPSDQNANTGALPKDANGVQTSEKTWARIVAEQVSVILRTVPGLEVRVGPDRLPAVDEYADRVPESNAWGADVHVCFHTNAGQGGTMICVYPSADSHKLGQALLDKLGPLTPAADPGLVDRDDLYELNSTACPAALIELDRHDTAEGVRVILSLVNSGAYAKAVVAALAEYCGFTVPVPPTKAATSTATSATAQSAPVDVASALVRRLPNATENVPNHIRRSVRIEKKLDALGRYLVATGTPGAAKLSTDLAAIDADPTIAPYLG